MVTNCVSHHAFGDAVHWPIILFEQDLYPVRFESVVDLESSALCMEMADEVRIGFDAQWRELYPQVVDGRLALTPGSSNATTVDVVLRTALICYWRDGAFRRVHATADQTLDILSMTSHELRSLFATRFEE